MTTPARSASSATRIHADHTVLKHLGDWTEDRSFHVRSRKSTVVLDLRAAGRDETDLLVGADDLAGVSIPGRLTRDIGRRAAGGAGR